MAKRNATPESGVLRGIMDLLAVSRVWFKRMNSRTVYQNGRPIFFGWPGMADVMATPKVNGVPIVLWVEAKAPKGKQSEAQKIFQAEVEAEGHTYLLVSDSSTLVQWLKGHGVIR